MRKFKKNKNYVEKNTVKNAFRLKYTYFPVTTTILCLIAFKLLFCLGSKSNYCFILFLPLSFQSKINKMKIILKCIRYPYTNSINK